MATDNSIPIIQNTRMDETVKKCAEYIDQRTGGKLVKGP